MICTHCKKPMHRPTFLGGVSMPFHSSCSVPSKKPRKRPVFGLRGQSKVRVPDYRLARSV